MKNFMRISEAASELNISRSALRNLALNNKISFETTPSGQRVFYQKHLDDFLGKPQTKVFALYARDSGGSKTNIQSQITKLTEIYGKTESIYKDAGSGLNENRKGLQKLLSDAKEGKFNTVAVTAKDRLTRFGFSFLEQLLNERGVTIIVFEDEVQKSLHEELLQDFMSLVASFSGKFYKIRGLEQRKRLLKKAGESLDADK